MWTNSEYIAGAGVCGIKPKTVPRRPLHHRSDFIYHLKRDDWQEEWGDRQEEWGDTDKKSEVTQTRRVRWHWQEEWGDTDKKSEVTQTRRVRWQTRRVRSHWQEEWGDTDKKSEVTQTRRWRIVSKRNVKAPVLSLLTSESDINLSQGENSPRSTKWKVNKL